MSRITKDLSREIAQKLTKDKQKEIKKVHDTLYEMLKVEVIKITPPHIMTFFKDFPKYCSKSNTVRVIGNGWNYQYFYLSEYLPSINGNNIDFMPYDTLSKALMAQFNHLEALKLEEKALRKDLEMALFNLRTFKNVSEQFPEASEFLPETAISTALQVDLTELRNKLKK